MSKKSQPINNYPHYLWIHKKVEAAAFQRLPQRVRDVIANDALHVTEEFRWFIAHVQNDAKRLYEDPAWWGNQKEVFGNIEEQLDARYREYDPYANFRMAA